MSEMSKLSNIYAPCPKCRKTRDDHDFEQVVIDFMVYVRCRLCGHLRDAH